MLIFKNRKIRTQKKLPFFFYWTGCKGTPFQLKKEKQVAYQEQYDSVKERISALDNLK